MSSEAPLPPPPSRTRTTLIAAFLLVFTFASGVIAGIVADRLMLRAGHHRVPRFATDAMVHRLDRHLDLTDEQRRQIEEIVRRRHQRINELTSRIRPRVRAEIDQTNDEIARILTPEQREKFDRMKLHLGRRHGRHGRPHP